MRIGCLGWGSLVWDPRDLPTRGIWFSDGPLLPIELARQSNDDRITLVLVPGKPVVRSLWSILSVRDADEARTALGHREGIPKSKIDQFIGVWGFKANGSDEVTQTIGQWASRLSLDSVVWTALPPKFKGEQREPTAEEVVEHLSNLSNAKRKNAEKYIRQAPRQIDTEYRRRIEAELHWTPTDT